MPHSATGSVTDLPVISIVFCCLIDTTAGARGMVIGSVLRFLWRSRVKSRHILEQIKKQGFYDNCH